MSLWIRLVALVLYITAACRHVKSRRFSACLLDRSVPSRFMRKIICRLTFNWHQSELLFKVIADRSERKSIIVSTNLAFSEWLTMFENQTMVAAMIDRLTYRSFVLNMNSSKPYRAEFAAQSDIPVL